MVVTDHDLGKALLGETRLRKSRVPRAQVLSRHGSDRSGVGHIAALNSHLLAADPPDHTRLRRLVSRAFTARRVAAMRRQVESRVSTLLDGLAVDVEAGVETTANLIGSGMSFLLREPDRLAALRSEPDLVSAAVEEMLLLSSPVHLSTPRFTAEPITCGGVPVPAGEIVLVSLLAANRDADRFPVPDVLDLARGRTSHLAFGHGIHYCLGALLARLETQTALRGLLGRCETITLTRAPHTLRWRRSVVIGGLESLPVRVTRDRLRDATT